MAQTNKGRKVYICSTAQPDDLDQTGFEALSWIEIGHVGNIGESGTSTNIVNYNTLADDVIQKGKGLSNAGDPQIECARVSDDVGQVALRAAALTHDFYAVKIVDDDAAAGYYGTSYYNRGLVCGPTRPNGRNEDFNLEVFIVACEQREVVVAPTPQSVPVNSALPSVQGSSIHTGGVLTAIEGSWTNGPITSYQYQWQQDTAGDASFVNIGGATNRTYTIVAGNAGNQLRVQVKGVNAAGAAASFASSLPTGVAINP